MVFFDSRGQVVALKDNDRDVVILWDGTPVAILGERSVYGFDGRHLGWFVNGWIRDHDGACVYYTDDAEGGPARPSRKARPALGARKAIPSRQARQPVPSRRPNRRAWSTLAIGSAFFDS